MQHRHDPNLDTQVENKQPPSQAKNVFIAILEGFVERFKSTFPPDGYDAQTGFSYPNIPTEVKNDKSELGMYLAAFLGLPSRPEGFLNDEDEVVPHLTLKQFLKGFIGGFDWAENTSSSKKLLQIFPGLLIKFFVILPFKLATWPLKFAVNITKLLEPLSFMIAMLFVSGLGAASAILFESSQSLPKFVAWIPHTIAYLIWILSYVVSIIAFATLLFADFVAIFALRPLETMKIVYRYFNSPLASIIFSLISFMISATLWAIAIPILLSAAIALFPALAGAVTFVAQIPLVASLLASTSGAFLGLSASVGTFFVSWSAYWAGVFGITLSSSIISVASAATIGFFAALIAVPACYIADTLSDRWAAWHEGSLLNALFGPTPKSYPISKPATETSSTQSSSHAHSSGSTSTHSKEADERARQFAEGRDKASKAEGDTDLFAHFFNGAVPFESFLNSGTSGQGRTHRTPPAATSDGPRVEEVYSSDDELDQGSTTRHDFD